MVVSKKIYHLAMHIKRVVERAKEAQSGNRDGSVQVGCVIFFEFAFFCGGLAKMTDT